MKNWDLSLNELVSLKEHAALCRTRAEEALNSETSFRNWHDEFIDQARTADEEALRIAEAIAADLHDDLRISQEDAAVMIFRNPEKYMQKRR